MRGDFPCQFPYSREKHANSANEFFDNASISNSYPFQAAVRQGNSREYAARLPDPGRTTSRRCPFRRTAYAPSSVTIGGRCPLDPPDVFALTPLSQPSPISSVQGPARRGGVFKRAHRD